MAKLVQKKGSRVKKELSLADLTEKISKSKSMVVADYRGLTMVQLQALRSALGESGEFTVAKNTIFSMALNKAGVADATADTFAGPSAVLFSYDDEVGPLKVLVKFAATAQNRPVIKGGILDKNILSADRVTALSKLPSKDQLRGQVVGGLVAPLTGLVGVLNGNIRNLVYALNQIKEQKGA